MHYGIEFAKELAERSFKGKTDLVGEPYMDHVNRVADNFKGGPEGYKILSYLHDIVEDCPEWNFESLAHFFPEYIIDALKCITKKEGEEYKDYIQRVKKNNLATEVKLADLRDNLSCWRLKEYTPWDMKRTKKYINAYQELS